MFQNDSPATKNGYDNTDLGMRQTGIQWMAWWYCAIAIGFALLGIEHMLTGDKAWLIGVRFVIAAGFGLLGWMEFHGKHSKR